MSENASSSKRMELYVRSLSSGTGVQVETMIDRLEEFTTEGEVEEYTVTVWGSRVSTDPAVARTDAGATIRERVAEFKQWATECGATLEGGFDRETIHSAITGETHEFISLPSVALACRRDGEVEWVVPSATAEEATPTTPMDRIRALNNERQESEPSDRAAVPSDD
ncbi:HTH domain-containing protein [Halocatena pleomorpha]|uniref:Uncharacterized protein n=1 Tax=Halocatena pleomorpha TaxID=1785090 RepID=A0A3P3RLN4_9EURY|nr:HTH domain-containing protein [Halocatena pleomorpha]RRJ33729.1 hypothetical protein EIK79_02750 [Halocatena pleomorpha]